MMLRPSSVKRGRKNPESRRRRSRRSGFAATQVAGEEGSPSKGHDLGWVAARGRWLDPGQGGQGGDGLAAGDFLAECEDGFSGAERGEGEEKSRGSGLGTTLGLG